METSCRGTGTDWEAYRITCTSWALLHDLPKSLELLVNKTSSGYISATPNLGVLAITF